MRTPKPKTFTLRLESNHYGVRKYTVVDHHGNVAGSVKVESRDAPQLESQWNGPKQLDGAELISPLAGGHRASQ
jgi:hypothetical protein